jgi:Flp pilus assembly secretin CpaC
LFPSRPLWAVAVGAAMLASSSVGPARAQNTTPTRIERGVALPLDKQELQIPLPAGSVFSIEEGESLVRATAKSTADRRYLAVQPLAAGLARVVVVRPDGSIRSYRIAVGSDTPPSIPAPAVEASLSANVEADSASTSAAPEGAENSGGRTVDAEGNAPTPRAEEAEPAAEPTPEPAAEPAPKPATEAAPLPALRPPATQPSRPSAPARRPAAQPTRRPSQSSQPSQQRPPRGLPTGVSNARPRADEAQISQPVLPPPSRLPNGRAPFPSAPTWTRSRAQSVAPRTRNTGRTITVSQGLARFVTFQQNILSVYFSNVAVMDARALTARAVAITGTAPGRSTLAINVAQSPTDTVGRFEIFTIVVEPATPDLAPTRDAAATELAIRAALADPRVTVRVIEGPTGTLAATLSGTLRESAELQAARETAALFVGAGSVISSLYLDPFAPTLSQVSNPVLPVTDEAYLQQRLRQATGNETIELVGLPGNLVVKGEVGSTDEAEVLLGLLSSLNTPVLPLITVRGRGAGEGANGDAGGDSRYYGANRPVLNGEDLAITRRLQEVTGVRTVYAVRTAQNAIAMYGTARDRREYDLVRRYAVMLPLIGTLAQQPTQTRSFNTGGGAAGAFPASGQSVGGAAGAGTTNPGGGGGGGAVNISPQVNPALQAKPGAPFYQGRAQIGGGFGGFGGTGTVAPTGPGTGGTGAFGAGGGTGAVAPPAPNTGDVPGGAGGGFNAGGFGSNVVGTTGLGAGGNNVGGGFSNQSAAQSSAGQSIVGLSQAEGFIDAEQALLNPANRAQQPATGYRQSVNIQMFVRILDPAANTVRRVTVESNIVEISRTSLRNLGIEAGTVGVLSENVNRGTAATAPTITINPTTGQQTITPGTPGTPDIITRTIDPVFRAGQALAGNGFAGGGPFQFIDPFRVRLNALYQKGNARILSRPNISAIEGADAQIVIGGERPVPSAVATGQAVGQGITFRRFGIILTMRPTVTDDDTIILQVRADVTELANEFGISLNGALIPGERVRSVNTTLTMRSGDTIVLGGLITNDRRQQTSRIPILSSIPILGNLFKSKRFENNESELAIFLSPRIDPLGASLNTREAINRVPALPALPATSLNDAFINGTR